MIHNSVTFDRRRAATRGVALWCGLALVGGAVAAEPAVRRPAPAAARPRVVVDHAVVPAGGMPCRSCDPAACPPHRGHVAECQGGMCAPHCPVRPSQYGYYKTQWRRWPGQDVVPVSAEEAATPAAPPRSQVPSVDEESPQAPGGETPGPDAGAEEAPAASPARDQNAPVEAAEPDALETEPIPEQPAAEEPPADQGGRPSEQPAREAPEPPTPPAGGNDLFDTSARPAADAPAAADPGRLRVPAPVGRSLATGAEPWRLDSVPRQRPADSARGL